MITALVVAILVIAFTIYLQRSWLKPFYALIERLYGRSANTDDKTNGRIQELERAIRFAIKRHQSNDAEEVERLTAELDELQRSLSDDHEILAEEKLKLEALQQETRDEKAHHLFNNALIGYAVRDFVGALNRGDEPITLLQHADTISFLAAANQRDDHTSTENLPGLIDSTLKILAPLLQQRGLRFHLSLSQNCPQDLELNATTFKQTLMLLILDHEPGSPQNIQMLVNFDNNRLLLQFSAAFQPHLTLALDELLDHGDATWQNSELSFPARQAYFTQPQSEELGLAALVIADNEYERLSLTWRLESLGVTCTTDFKSNQIDMCVVSDDNSETFLAIKAELDQTTYILAVNSERSVNQPYWTTLTDPVCQSTLRETIEHIGRTRDESRKLHTLIVDDSAANARLLGLQLSELGHTHDDAESGIAALDLVNANSYQIIFMDIQMPDMNGIEATRKIRQLGLKIPIFGLTAHATSQEKEVYRSAGMDDVLIKPVRLENLKSILRRLGRLTPKPPLAAPASTNSDVFDKEMALRNANHRPELALELLTLLLQSLPEDQAAIMAAAEDKQTLRQAVHKLHGAVRYCGVPRLGRAIEKLESAIKQGDDEQIPILLNLLSGEITTLSQWYQDNPDPFNERSALNVR